VLPSGKTSTITRIVTLDGDLDRAVAGQSVTLCFADEVDCSRGDVIAIAEEPPECGDGFEAHIVWMSDEPMLPGRAYWLKIGAQTVTASIQAPKHQINVNTLEKAPAKTLELFAPRAERALASTRRLARAARATEAPTTRSAVVHRAFRRR
jgi:bifunctional enzyme CysN/CysC